MAVLRVPEQEGAEARTLADAAEITAYLAERGIAYERVERSPDVTADTPAETVLATYAPLIDALKRQGGYVTADVIDVKPETPNLDAMLKKFSSEHWHDEDEVRLILEGRGIFHIHLPDAPVFALEVAPGDLIRVPKGTHHWFDLCGERRIRAIRLFQDVSGWTPHYTSSGVDARFQPLCFGPAYLPPERIAPSLVV